jgi:hypothetical protein
MPTGDATGTCDRHMRRAYPRRISGAQMHAQMRSAHAEENRTEDGRTDNRNHFCRQQNPTVCTRARARGKFS